ncbi:MAG: hypothetical protein Q9171_001030 [Xanthocarpia ochracea]
MAHIARNVTESVLLDGPALQPPPGVVANVTNRSDEQFWYYVCISVCTVIPGNLLCLRFYTKLRIIRKVDLTDYLTITSFALYLAMWLVGRQILANGAAVHQWNVQLKHLIRLRYWLYVSQILYAPIIFLVKAAILLQYLRLLAPTKTVNPSMFIGARVIIVVTGVYYTICTPVIIWACTPREKIWNPLITEGHCLHDNIAVIFACLFNIASDVAILVLPARSVWRLQIPRRKKIGIVSLFAIGLLACLANVCVIIYTVRMGEEDADFTYNAAWQCFWVYAEISLGIIVTCTLTLPKFIEARGKRLRAMALTISKPFGTLAHSTRSRLVKTETIVPSDSTAAEDGVATDSLEWRRVEDQSLETHSIEAHPKSERWSTVPIYNQILDRIELV